MIAREHKVPLRTLPQFFITATRTGVRGLTLYIQRTDEQLKVTVVVPKHAALLSTARSQVRRRVYQIFEEQWQELSVLQVAAVIVVAKNFVELAPQEQRVTVEKLLQEKILPFATL